MEALRSVRKEAISLGHVRYFTGSPCKYGHVSERWSANAKCVACHQEKLINTPPASDHEKEEKARARARRWYEANKQKTIERSREWKSNNPSSVAASMRKWRSTPEGKTICFMRDSLRRVLKTEKKGRTEKILGYTRQDLISHIQALFLPGMTWQNHGEWHIDHILPISLYLSAGITDPKKINALSNLQPLWAAENIAKGAKIE